MKFYPKERKLTLFGIQRKHVHVQSNQDMSHAIMNRIQISQQQTFMQGKAFPFFVCV